MKPSTKGGFFFQNKLSSIKSKTFLPYLRIGKPKTNNSTSTKAKPSIFCCQLIVTKHTTIANNMQQMNLTTSTCFHHLITLIFLLLPIYPPTFQCRMNNNPFRREIYSIGDLVALRQQDTANLALKTGYYDHTHDG